LARELVAGLVAAGAPPAAAAPARWDLLPKATVQAVARRLLGELPSSGR
jgi:hypothetical protein